ncbi:NADH-quinone oxidoreductase subunit J [Longispora sp. NPDC051575]|uniref:NADH-quinone oxidoreductase subunit J n=1 Tax=Longispora sp. NPDC051575 TaxID=3154943 RepID=UPI003433C2EB
MTTALLAADATPVSAWAWIVWGVLALVAVAGGVGMVLAKNAVHSALFLVCTMLTLGVFYIIQAGPFIGMVQIIVYTGAIMMLFLFVLMLIGRDASDSLIETLRGQRTAALLLGIGFAGLVVTGVVRALGKAPVAGLAQANADGNTQGIAKDLFTSYVFAFEVSSALLITAAVGAMLLAHVEKTKAEKVTQRDLMQARFAPGNYPAPKPGPGVFASTNSVAAPGLLPDGSVAGRSLTALVPTRELTEAEAKPKGTEK